MKRIIYYIIGTLISIQLQVNANDYIFDPVTSSSGITFNAINTITDDKYGFIWFGSNNGLYYYNSAEVKKVNFELSHPNASSSNTIRYLYKDNNQRLWVCTNNGISYLDEENNTFKKLKFIPGTTTPNLNASLLYQINDDKYLTLMSGSLFTFNINDLKLEPIEIGAPGSGVAYFTSDNSGNLYFAAGNGSIYKADSSLTEINVIYQKMAGPVTTLSFIDDQLWIGYLEHGIEVISADGAKDRVLRQELEGRQHIISNRVRRIIKGPDNEIWIGMTGGITVLNSKGNDHILPNIQNGLPHEAIFDLFLDRNNGVWVATWSGGLAYYHRLNYKFPYFQSTFASNSDWNSVISSFAEDHKGTIWVGCENHGLHMYDPKNNSYTKKADSPVRRVKSIATDGSKRLWIGTFYEGLWLKAGSELKRIGNIEGIFSTVSPVENGVWIGQRGGGAIFYNERQNTFDYFMEDAQDSLSISSNLIWYIFRDSEKNMWFCTDNGISVRYNTNEYFTNYYAESNGLSSNLNYTLSEDHEGKIWIGTAGSGIDIFDPKTKTFSKFRLNNAIENADVYCILKDMNDDMWFSSNQGIYAYYHDSQELKHFTKEDGLLGHNYHPNSGFISSQGLMYFGGGNGFSIIDPEIVQPNTNRAEIFLSELTINNQNLAKESPKFINSGNLTSVNQIELKHNQNTIGFAFVANSFIKNSKSKFRYRLLNYIDEWNIAGYNANVSFTKIPPGDYILQIEYLNSDGLSVAPIKEVQIEINPPFWLSWYAYLLYSLVIITVIFIALRELRFREKSRAEHILFTEKIKFFTNISHEFRTPLTLIISPLNTLIKRYANEPKTFDSLSIIQRNADRLLRLTNQILDFRLIELNKVKLKRENVDLIAVCKNVYACFEYQINEKEINCVFNSSFKSFIMYVDPEKIEKVVYNILSNALKYSEEKGQIILSIDKKTLSEKSYDKIFSTGNTFIGDVLEVKIKDNGKGIKKSILTNIFDRFFVDTENSETGTGIGLHICHEYVRLHNGNIMVESEPGKETIFTINIPIESEASFEKENVILQSFFDRTTKKTQIEEQDFDSKVKPLVLFAEDNNELRAYYKNLLSSNYKVISAKNGTQAFEIASELHPNLIISDILMPGMDGMLLTEQIRNSSELKDIPIILLTALSDNKSKIESMQKGANDFITKPVDEEVLFAKIDSILSNTEVIRNKYKELADKAADVYSSNQPFIEKVEQIIENNIQNQSFEITALASQVGISRSSLQRKIKKAVNMSPSEFIREVRLKKAVLLIKKSEYNIDEIAVIVGFNSTSYFIRSFKKKYDMTPTAYKQNMEK